MALSVDLRKRVIAAVDENMPVSEAARLFKVARRNIYYWLDLRKKSNNLNPKNGYQRGHSHKIKNLDEFKLFVEENKHSTAKQMVIDWEKKTNVKMSETVMGRYLKRIGYSRKKNVWLYGS